MESQDLSDEDSETDVNAGNEAQEASQVLGSDLTEIHRHHTETDTCGVGGITTGLNVCLTLCMFNFVLSEC